MSSWSRDGVTGETRYVGDVRFSEELSLVVVRSTIARGVIRRIDASVASLMDGVKGIFSATDLLSEFGAVPFIKPRLTGGLDPETFRVQPVLADQKVHYVGEPVAVVLAESLVQAVDAAESVEVEIEPEPGFWRLDNGEILAVFEGLEGDPWKAFAEAPVVIEREFSVGRQCPAPIEPRGLVANIEKGNGQLEIWGWTKVPQWNRSELARQLGIPAETIRIREVAVGGSFGMRGEFYPEDFLVPWSSLRLGRPVRWIEQRSEHFLAANQGREQAHRAAIAGDQDGRILAIRTDFRSDLGAYVRTSGVVAPRMTATMIAGPYSIQNTYARCELVLTDRTPTGTYRGPGRVESCFVRERLIDIYANAIGRDSTEVRSKNLIGDSDLPIRRQPLVGGPVVEIDEGYWGGLFDKVVSSLDWNALEIRRLAGERVGIGLACFLERSGLGPWEWGSVKVGEDGCVEVRSGCTSVGQGVEEVLETIAATSLGVDRQRVRYVLMDSDFSSEGVGTFASRSTVMGGNAVHLAALELIASARRIVEGGNALGGEDVEYSDGTFFSSGGKQLLTLAEVAAAQEGGFLFAEARFESAKVSADFGVHAAQVRIDPETGEVNVERLVLGFDIGPCINEENVRGQIYGGAVQAVGGALLEEVLYDQHGSPIVTSFADYTIPSAVESPEMTVILETGHSSSLNPLGLRGCGEAGITGAYAAIANAVARAIGDPEAVTRVPIRPEALVQWILGRPSSR